MDPRKMAKDMKEVFVDFFFECVTVLNLSVLTCEPPQAPTVCSTDTVAPGGTCSGT